MSLSIRRLQVALPGHAPFFSIDIEASSNERVVLVGPNGCGKSTLLKCLSGVYPLNCEQYLIGERELSGLSSQKRSREVGYVPQRFDPRIGYSVQEFLEISHGGKPSDGFQEVLSLCSLEKLGNCAIDQLSGGELQQVLLASALTHNPRLLLLDEPSAHLDPQHQLSLLNTLNAFQSKRSSVVLLVTHDLNFAQALSSRLIVFSEGGVRFDGLFSDPALQAVIQEVFQVSFQPNFSLFAQGPFHG